MKKKEHDCERGERPPGEELPTDRANGSHRRFTMHWLLTTRDLNGHRQHCASVFIKKRLIKNDLTVSSALIMINTRQGER